MAETRELVRHIIVNVFNDVLALQEKFIQTHGIPLSISEVHTLEAIKNAKDNNRMSDVAEALNITLSTLSINIKRLVPKGYVRRVTDDADRRVVHLVLTEAALNVLDVHDKFHDDLVDSFFEDLKIDEDLILLDSLEKIDRHLKKLLDNLTSAGI